MKEFKIEIPEGMEIDTDASSLIEGIIKFKKRVIPKPKRWGDLDSVSGFKIGQDSEFTESYESSVSEWNKNIFPTLADAESSLALSQLLQLRKAWIGDWVADWSKGSLIDKFTISRVDDKLSVNKTWTCYDELSFPYLEVANEFKDTFKDLIDVYFKLNV